jgi:hypothetical protein
MLCKEAIMVSPAWREELKEELVRQELPPSYIERLVQELSDHFNDVMEESMSMEAEKSSLATERVGQPSRLAAAAVTEYHKRAYTRKYPVVTFAILPVLLLAVLLAVLWAGMGVAAYVADEVVGIGDLPTSHLYLRALSDGTTGVMLAPLVVIAMIFCRLARNNGPNWRWPMLTTGILAIIAGMFYNTVLSSGPSNEPILSLVVGLPLTVQQWLQSMLILVIGGWCCWRVRQAQAPAYSASGQEEVTS